MRPLNLDNSPCTPTSSNCVIWSGPSLGCINLCTGDTISDVVAKLATELCTILDTLNVSNYDLACLNLNTCAPSDFEQLIQLLIDKVCALENAPADPSNPPSTGCPTDCIVSTKGCLIGPDEPDGEDTLINYIQAIATRVCSIISEIDVINSSIDVINTTLLALEAEIAAIPVYTLPNISITCTIGAYPSGSSVRLDTLVTAFINNVWCPYVTTTGSAAQIAAAIQPDCVLTDIISEPGWTSPINTLADAINNIWVSICYFYNLAVPTTIVTGSDGITVTPTTVGSTTTYDVSLTTPLSAIMPAGAVIPWASPNAVAPIGWLFCDGAFYDGALYPDLYLAIGTTYGTTVPGFFAVPTMTSRIPVGAGPNSDGYDLTSVGNTGGARVEALSDAQIPPHTHDLSAATISGTTGSAGTHRHGIWADNNNSAGSGAITLTSDTGSDYDTTPQTGAEGNGAYLSDEGAHTHGFSGSITGTTGDGSPALQGAAHGNMQPYIVMQYIIKY